MHERGGKVHAKYTGRDFNGPYKGSFEGTFAKPILSFDYVFAEDIHGSASLTLSEDGTLGGEGKNRAKGAQAGHYACARR